MVWSRGRVDVPAMALIAGVHILHSFFFPAIRDAGEQCSEKLANKSSQRGAGSHPLTALRS